MPRMLYTGPDDGFLQHGRHYDVELVKKLKGRDEIVIHDGLVSVKMAYYGDKFYKEWRKEDGCKDDQEGR